MHSQEADKLQAVKKLQHDLLNSPLHCFGCHWNCSPDFYKTVQQQQQHQQQSNNQASTAGTALAGNNEGDATTNDTINDTTSGMRQ